MIFSTKEQRKPVFHRSVMFIVLWLSKISIYQTAWPCLTKKPPVAYFDLNKNQKLLGLSTLFFNT